MVNQKTFAWMIFSLAGLAGVAFGADSAINAGAKNPIFSVANLAYEYPEYLEGSIYAQGAEPKRLLFRFKRVATRSASTLNVDRDFTYPDGRIAAKEHVVYQGNSLATYELAELQMGAKGSVIARPASAGRTLIEFQYSSSLSDRMKPRIENVAGEMLIADMVGPFLAAHWDLLIHGEKVRCRYIVVQRKETVGFTFSKVGSGTTDNENTITLKMEPTSAVLSLMINPLFFTIEKTMPHRVLRYTGRTTPKVKVGSKWEDLDAVTVFDWQTAR
jgi:hypothetical protein